MPSALGARARWWCTAAFAYLLVTPRLGFASGFLLLEASPRLQGTSYAGTAALAEDASTNFYNPAGLTRLPNWSLVQDGYLVAIQTELKDATATTFGQPVSGPDGSRESTPGTDSFVPAGFVAKHLSDDLSVGFGASAPFGLEVIYSNDSIARFIATKSKLVTYNLNPSIAYRIAPGLSLGVGFDAQYATVALNQKLLLGNELNVRLSADDWTFGWNAGLLYELTPETRLGVSYRSRLTYTFTGDANVTDNPLVSPQQHVKATVTLPDFLILSGVTQLAPRLQLLGDFAWTHWALLNEIKGKFSPGSANDPRMLLPTFVIPTQFRDTLRGALGLTYTFDKAWKGRTGIGFDQSPVTDANRTARIPDANRILLSFGIGYALTESFTIDLAYTHIFIPYLAKIDQTALTPDASTLRGKYDSAVDLAGFQFTFNLDRLPALN
jgi:long-chain fatty acid transport protein